MAPTRRFGHSPNDNHDPQTKEPKAWNPRAEGKEAESRRRGIPEPKAKESQSRRRGIPEPKAKESQTEGEEPQTEGERIPEPKARNPRPKAWKPRAEGEGERTREPDLLKLMPMIFHRNRLQISCQIRIISPIKSRGRHTTKNIGRITAGGLPSTTIADPKVYDQSDQRPCCSCILKACGRSD